MVFLEFSKAFDLVNHSLLIRKLNQYGVGEQLLECCKDYLRNRQQRVVVCGGTYDWLTVTSGVPQGSILGPLFFIIYINDLPGVVCDGNKIVLYADDSKLYKVIHSVHDQECFQCDLNKTNEWCLNNKMRINASKCKVMRITKKKSPFTYDYHINGAKLNSVSLHRDLGLLTSDVLSWNFHIANITA